jgi:8-oxo-dGTP pyrophosphatase MutT (NUDIX family)
MDWKKQVGALPVRRDRNGAIRVLLVTSRETRRLVIPKGWPWPGVKDWKAAAEEAREEAGIRGRISKKPVGSYTYDKRRASGSVPVRVKVFLLEVEEEMDDWPESLERERQWFTPGKAAAFVEEPELAELILAIAVSLRQPKPARNKTSGKATD